MSPSGVQCLINLNLADLPSVRYPYGWIICFCENAKEILSSKGNEFNFLKEIIDLRMVNIFIDLEDLERANNILKNTFLTYQTNKLILQGDILAIEKKIFEAKQKYIDALGQSENETQKNLINLKISTLID